MKWEIATLKTQADGGEWVNRVNANARMIVLAIVLSVAMVSIAVLQWPWHVAKVDCEPAGREASFNDAESANAEVAEERHVGALSATDEESVSDGVFPLSKGGTPGYTNTLHVMVEDGGLAVLDEHGDSDSPFVIETPARFATNELTFSYAMTGDRIIHDSFPNTKKREYIVFRTAPPAGGTNDFNSGIIRDLRCAPGRLKMEYFFNPHPGDARIDGDLKSKCDIKL